jgi:hypothetical protein
MHVAMTTADPPFPQSPLKDVADQPILVGRPSLELGERL